MVRSAKVRTNRLLKGTAVRYGFVIDQTSCIGCHACTVACKTEHEVPLGVNRTWVKYIEKGAWPDTKRFFSVMRCNHCTDAPCVEICPTTALFKRNDGIVVVVNIGGRETWVETGPGISINESGTAGAGNSFFGVGDFEGGALAIVGSLEQAIAAAVGGDTEEEPIVAPPPSPVAALPMNRHCMAVTLDSPLSIWSPPPSLSAELSSSVQ